MQLTVSVITQDFFAACRESFSFGITTAVLDDLIDVTTGAGAGGEVGTFPAGSCVQSPVHTAMKDVAELWICVISILIFYWTTKGTI